MGDGLLETSRVFYFILGHNILLETSIIFHGVLFHEEVRYPRVLGFLGQKKGSNGRRVNCIYIKETKHPSALLVSLQPLLLPCQLP